MSNPISEPKSKKSWAKILGAVAAGLVLLLVVVYFVATSGAFIKSFILPKAGAALNATITAEDVSLSPFSSLTIRQLKLVTTGTQPLVTAAEARVRYSLFKIIGGSIDVDEVTLIDPVVNVVVETNGTSNLTPLMGTPSAAKKSDAPAKPLKLNLRNIKLQNGQVQFVTKGAALTKTIGISSLNISLDQLVNNQPGKLTLGGAFRMADTGSTNPPSAIAGKLDGAFNLTLNDQMMPTVAQGNLQTALSEATGTYVGARGMAIALNADTTATEIKQLAIRFTRDNQLLSELAVSGPLNTSTLDARLKISLTSINKEVLGLVAPGMDFGATVFNSTNDVTLLQNAQAISVTGAVQGREISVTTNGKKTPVLSTDLSYAVSVDLAKKSALIQNLDLQVDRQKKSLISAHLKSPMNLSFGGPMQGVPASTLSLDVTDLSLAEWAELGGNSGLKGLANLKTTIETRNEGRYIGLSMDGKVTGLTVPLGTNSLENMGVELHSEGTLEASAAGVMNQLSLPVTTVTLSQGTSRLLTANAAVRYDVKLSDGNVQSSAELLLPNLVNALKLPNMAITAGTLKITSTVSLKAASQTISGGVQLQGLTGKLGAINFVNYQTAVDVNAEISPELIKLQRLLINLADQAQKGGSISLSGQYAAKLGTGKFDLVLDGVNESALRPFLADSLGENQLTSILLQGTHTLTITNRDMLLVQSSQQITNWVVGNRKTGQVLGPLAIALAIDGTFSPGLVDLRQLTLQLSPTARAQNKLDLRAFVDLHPTNAKPSTITLSSPALDVTPYADMFASKKPTDNTTKTPPSTPAKTGGGDAEPAPITLPLKLATAKIDIGRFYLRDLAASNILVEARLDNGKIAIKPLSVDMNGAPIRGEVALDVTVPGYIYAVGMRIQSLPLAPLTGDTNLNGNLTTDLQVKGKGVTGASLQKNLEGLVTLSLTNMHRQIVTGWAKTIVTPIALLLNLPELQSTPVSQIDALVKIGGGKIDLQPVAVKSEAFLAEALGGITLSEVLTNSPMVIPLRISLKRSLAEKAGLLAPNTPTNAAYSALPEFATVKGTVGAPSVDIDKLKLAGLTARGLLGSGLTRSLGLGKDAGNALGNAANFLTGPSASTNAAPSTNTPAGNLIQGLGGLLGGAKNAATNAPAATNRTTQGEAILQGLGGLFNKPKAATNAPAKP